MQHGASCATGNTTLSSSILNAVNDGDDNTDGYIEEPKTKAATIWLNFPLPGSNVLKCYSRSYSFCHNCENNMNANRVDEVVQNSKISSNRGNRLVADRTWEVEETGGGGCRC